MAQNGPTAQLQKRICQRIERGNYPETSAVAEGVPARTFWRWMRRGRELADQEESAAHDGRAETDAAASTGPKVRSSDEAKGAKSGALDARCRDFAVAVDRARARAEADLVEVIRKGDTKERKVARAAGWLLERTRSKRFGAVVRHRVEDELERMLDIAERVLTRPDFLRLCEAIAAADRADETGEDSGRGEAARAGATGPDAGAAGSAPIH